MANLNFCPIKGNLSIPTHEKRYNVPVDLGVDSYDYSKEEWLTIRPFRSSWKKEEWGFFQGCSGFKPVTYDIAITEIVSFFDRLTQSTFAQIIKEQCEQYHDDVGHELTTLSIVLFGYKEFGIDWRDVVETHLNLEATYVTIEDLASLRKTWLDHGGIKADVHHATEGGWAHLTHSWCVCCHINGHPGSKRRGIYLAHVMSQDAWENYLISKKEWEEYFKRSGK